MKSAIIVGGVVVLSGLVLVSQGFTQDGLPQDGLPGFDAVDTPADVVAVEPNPQSDLDSLRQQYVESARQRAELMDEAALQQAIEVEEAAVAELRAAEKLNAVQRQLEQLVEEHGDTAAGRMAAQLLTHARSPLPEPVEDTRFRSNFSRALSDETPFGKSDAFSESEDSLPGGRGDERSLDFDTPARFDADLGL